MAPSAGPLSSCLLILSWSIGSPMAADVTTTAASAASPTPTDLLTSGLLGYFGQTQPADNVILSPLSIRLALSMLYHGTGNGSAARTQLEALLANGGGGDFASGLRDVAKKVLASRSRLAAKNVTLQLGNGLFLNGNFSAKPAYASLLGSAYDASVQRLTGSNSDKVVFVNEWVSKKTAGLIPSLLSDGAIDQETAALLFNTIYFKGGWANSFQKDLTAVRRFKLSAAAAAGNKGGDKNSSSSGGAYVETDFMFREIEVLLADNPGRMRVLSLPYTSPGVSMLIILPDESVNIDDLAKEVFSAPLTGLLQAAREVTLRLYLPKFKLDTKVSLIPALESLDVRDIFDYQTRPLTEISEVPIDVGEILHAARLEVSEEGTEAAAVTGISIDIRLAVAAPRELAIDRPFLFAIVDDNGAAGGGAPLFAGKIMDPTGGKAERLQLEPEKDSDDVLLQAREDGKKAAAR